MKNIIRHFLALIVLLVLATFLVGYLTASLTHRAPVELPAIVVPINVSYVLA